MITISDVEECFLMTLRKKATPHREPDFKVLKKVFGPDTPVKGRRWFIEEHNTGYEGVLERWQFRGGEEPNDFSFWADILPGLLTAVRAEVSQ